MKPGQTAKWAVSRDLPLSKSHSIVRVGESSWLQVEDEVVEEYPLTIFVNDNELATVVCSPANLTDLVVGFLASEGVIRSIEQVRDCVISLHTGTARVQTDTPVTFNQAFYNKRYIASCCGKSRQSFYFYNDAQTAKSIDDDSTIDAGNVLLWMREMDEEARLFQATGGVHVASLRLSTGERITRTDIGRHNALDKIYGYVLQTGADLTGSIITFSGRLSSEVMLKVSKIGVPIVLAKSAPTSLAIDMAEELHITAVGFVRGNSFNIYTHPERIRTE
jgi:FdhD protein